MKFITYSPFYYSSERLVINTDLYHLKVCYQPHLSFLRNKTTISLSMSNRLAKGNKYIRAYKSFRMYYISTLRANFGLKTPAYLISYKFQTKIVYEYFQEFKRSKALKDLNYALIWKALQISPLFKLITTARKKKKKIFYTHRVNFIKLNKRILTVWVWLKQFLKSLEAVKQPIFSNLPKGLENFFMALPENHVLEEIKLQIYKLQLARSL